MKMTFRTAAALGVMLLGGLTFGVATAHAQCCGGGGGGYRGGGYGGGHTFGQDRLWRLRRRLWLHDDGRHADVWNEHGWHGDARDAGPGRRACRG